MKGRALPHRWLFLAALIALSAVPFWRFFLLAEHPLPEGYLRLLSPRVPSQPTPWNALWWDSIGQFWAWATEVQRQTEMGFFPLWSARIGNGFPLYANPQVQTLYFPRLSLNLLLCPTPTSPLDRPHIVAFLLTLLSLFHSFLALAGTYWFLRISNCSSSASLIGACVYGLGSHQIAWTMIPTVKATGAWLPLCAGLLVKAVTPGPPQARSLALLSLALSGLILSGHGQVAVYALMAIVVLACYFLASHRSLPSLLFLSCSFAVAFLLSACHILPLAELIPRTHRSAPLTPESLRPLSERAMAVTDWLTLLAPFLYGNPLSGTYFGKESYADFTAYCGVSSLLLSSFAFVHRLATGGKETTGAAQNGGEIAPFVLLILTGLALSSFPLIHILFSRIWTGFTYFGTPARALLLVQLGLAGLTGRGWDAIVSGHPPWKGIVGLATAVIGALVLTAVSLWAGLALFMEENTTVLLGWLGFVVGVGSAVPCLSRLANRPVLRLGALLLICGEFIGFSGRTLPGCGHLTMVQALRDARASLPSLEREPEVPVRVLPLGKDWSLIGYPRTLFPPNSLLLIEPFGDLRCYDSLLLRSHKALMADFSQGNPCPMENGNLILMPEDKTDRDAGAVLGAQWILRWQNKEVKKVDRLLAPFAYLPERLRAEPSDTMILKSLRDTKAIVLRGTPAVRNLGLYRPLSWKRSDGQIAISIPPDSVTGREAWIVIREQAYPGWKAFASDGRRRISLRLLPVNFAFMGCRFPKGTDKIVLVFFPESFAVGLFLTLTASGLVVGWLLLARAPMAR